MYLRELLLPRAIFPVLPLRQKNHQLISLKYGEQNVHELTCFNRGKKKFDDPILSLDVFDVV